MAPRRYEWDDVKREANLAKHRVEFEAIERLDWDLSVTRKDARYTYGETRFVTFAPLDGRIHAVAYTIRGGTHRIISLRKANSREQAAYVLALSAGLGRR
jgi:uncharacterized DUF497 family protein